MSSQNNIDDIILKNVGPSGFFIEAGGSDPNDQNNTLLLEMNGWKGLVVEPKIEFNKSYQNIRLNTIVENYVLVSFEHKEDTIMGDFSHYMMGGVLNTHNFQNWSPLSYPCTTLDFLLKKHNITEVTFFSLDVEGYETEVLNGINFNDVFFHILVIENHEQKGYKDDFSFMEKYGFEKKFVLTQHEFYINKKSKYYNTFKL
jgi:FkbM family methyltransferase